MALRGIPLIVLTLADYSLAGLRRYLLRQNLTATQIVEFYSTHATLSGSAFCWPLPD
jgi:hypothetical protein